MKKLKALLTFRRVVAERLTEASSEATRALWRVNAKPSLGSALRDAHDSSPARSASTLATEDRVASSSKVDAAHAASLVASSSALSQLRRLKRSRSPGVDGFAVERLDSASLGGSRDSQLERGALERRATLLRRLVVGESTARQPQPPRATKLAAAPKSERES